MAVDGWAVTFGTARWAAAPLSPLIAVSAHPSTASVPIIVLLLCGFNVAIKGLNVAIEL